MTYFPVITQHKCVCVAGLCWCQEDDVSWPGGYESALDGDAYIINGQDAEKGRWPWLLSLEVLDPEYRHTCGASLLGKALTS